MASAEQIRALLESISIEPSTDNDIHRHHLAHQALSQQETPSAIICVICYETDPITFGFS